MCLVKGVRERQCWVNIFMRLAPSAAYTEPLLLMHGLGTMCHTLTLHLYNWQQTGVCLQAQLYCALIHIICTVCLKVV